MKFNKKIGLSIGHKCALICVMYTIPIVALLYFLTAEKNKSIEFTEKEMMGNEYLRESILLLTDLARYKIRHVSQHNLSASISSSQDIEELKQRINDRMLQLKALQSKFGDALRMAKSDLAGAEKTHAHPDQIDIVIQSALESSTATGAINETQKKSIMDLRDQIRHISDSSNLVLDPDLDSFYLMDAVIVAMPELLDQIQASATSSLQTSKEKSTNGEQPAAILAYSLKQAVDRYSSSLRTSIAEDSKTSSKDDWLQKNALSSLTKLESTIRSLGDAFETNDRPSAFRRSLEVLAACEETFQNGQKSLQSLLHTRLASIELERQNTLIWSIVFWLAAGALSFMVQRSISNASDRAFKRLDKIASELNLVSVNLHSSAQRSASATSQEAAAIQQSVAAMTEMTSMLALTAQHTSDAKSDAERSMTQAKKGMTTMHSLSSAMKDIAGTNSRLKEITKIISDISSRTTVINDIVFKTQLLAVNASIEAARAGHHGKGFAVVANEVANLATLSGKAANEIRHLLDESRAQVADIVANTSGSVEVGTQVSQEARESFEHLAEAIDSFHSKIEQIYDATREQEAGVQQTSQAMSELSLASTSNASLARENTLLSDKAKQQSQLLINVQRAMSYILFGTERRKTTQRTHELPVAELSSDNDNIQAVSIHRRTNAKIAADSTAQSGLQTRISVAKSASLKEIGSLGRVSTKASLAAKISQKSGMKSAMTPSSFSIKPTTNNKQSGRFTWQSSYDIGVESMNNEHKHLLELMADLESAYLSKASIHEQMSLLDALAAYTVQHFSDEERFFDSIDFPDANTHKEIHKNLLEKLRKHAESFKQDGELNEEFFRFLRTWLSAHIQGVDMKYGEFSRNKYKKAA